MINSLVKKAGDDGIISAVFNNADNTYQMYLNGTEVGSGNLVSGSFDSSSDFLMVGENPGPWVEHFIGEMGQVQVFDIFKYGEYELVVDDSACELIPDLFV